MKKNISGNCQKHRPWNFPTDNIWLQAAYHLRMGSMFMGHAPNEEDAEVVRRLKACGAIILGVTNMQENGMGTTGINVSK